VLIRRVIPVLDVKGGRLVKGVQFDELRDAGDPVQAARAYATQGADELVVLDISGDGACSSDFCELVGTITSDLPVPVTAGGGVRTVQEACRLIEAGASKVSVGSACAQDPQLIARIAARIGREAVVAAVDVRWAGNGWRVHSHGGERGTGREAIAWCRELDQLGAGEILLTSMDRDGTTAGYDTDLIRYVTEVVGCPVIANGGAGRLQDFVEACRNGASGVLAASLFHFRHLTIQEVKDGLAVEGFAVA
jgi:cyclase